MMKYKLNIVLLCIFLISFFIGLVFKFYYFIILYFVFYKLYKNKITEIKSTIILLIVNTLFLSTNVITQNIFLILTNYTYNLSIIKIDEKIIKDNFGFVKINNDGNLMTKLSENELIKKRDLYNTNNILKNYFWTNKVIFIPFNKEEIIIYDYGLFKNYAIKDLESNNNECQLLKYGSENGWDNYKEKLKSKNNECKEIKKPL